MKELVKEVILIAKAAGEEILKVYADESQFDVALKTDQSPLTLADRNANELIVSALSGLSSQYPIISEEKKLQPYRERKDYELFWLVDPLDGTKEFIKRNGEFTVNIALVKRNSPVLGVVYVPVSGEMYWAIRGDGAYYEDRDGDRKRLSANSYKNTDKGLRVVCSRSHINSETQEFIDELDEPVAVSKGSSLKFLLIAAGEAEIYPRLGPTMEWDTGAAQIILEEAGGEVIQFDNSSPLAYNKENLLNPYFIARAKLTQ